MKSSVRYAVLSVLGVVTAMPVTVLHAADINLEQRIIRLEQMASNPVMLQLTQRINDQQAEIQRLQDRVDHLIRDQQLLQDSTKTRYQETDERLSALESSASRQTTGSAGSEGTEGLTDEVPTSASKVIATRDSTEAEKQAYQKAFSLMKAAKYKESIAAFESFLQSSADSDLAGNAAYWAGEGHFILQKYTEALNSFNVVIERYPTSPKFDDSQLRAGDCLDNLKQPKEAKAMYQGLVTTSPDSKAGQNAAKRLEKLR